MESSQYCQPPKLWLLTWLILMNSCSTGIALCLFLLVGVFLVQFGKGTALASFKLILSSQL